MTTTVIEIGRGSSTHHAYLGDGLYVEIVSGMIRLYCERSGGTHEVFMEPVVLDAFMNYVDNLSKTGKTIPNNDSD